MDNCSTLILDYLEKIGSACMSPTIARGINRDTSVVHRRLQRMLADGSIRLFNNGYVKLYGLTKTLPPPEGGTVSSSKPLVGFVEENIENGEMTIFGGLEHLREIEEKIVELKKQRRTVLQSMLEEE